MTKLFWVNLIKAGITRQIRVRKRAGPALRRSKTCIFNDKTELISNMKRLKDLEARLKQFKSWQQELKLSLRRTTNVWRRTMTMTKRHYTWPTLQTEPIRTTKGRMSRPVGHLRLFIIRSLYHGTFFTTPNLLEFELKHKNHFKNLNWPFMPKISFQDGGAFEKTDFFFKRKCRRWLRLAAFAMKNKAHFNYELVSTDLSNWTIRYNYQLYVKCFPYFNLSAF